MRRSPASVRGFSAMRVCPTNIYSARQLTLHIGLPGKARAQPQTPRKTPDLGPLGFMGEDITPSVITARKSGADAKGVVITPTSTHSASWPTRTFVPVMSSVKSTEHRLKHLTSLIRFLTGQNPEIMFVCIFGDSI